MGNNIFWNKVLYVYRFKTIMYYWNKLRTIHTKWTDRGISCSPVLWFCFIRNLFEDRHCSGGSVHLDQDTVSDQGDSRTQEINPVFPVDDRTGKEGSPDLHHEDRRPGVSTGRCWTVLDPRPQIVRSISTIYALGDSDLVEGQAEDRFLGIHPYCPRGQIPRQWQERVLQTRV